MSLLQRWSLPSRGFIRDNKSQDGESGSTEHAKYPTMHLGQMGPRRRANLSSVFSTLFEKPENRHDVQRGNNTGNGQGAEGLPLLASRRENIRPDVESEYLREHEAEHQGAITTIGTAPLQQGGSMFASLSKNSTIDPDAASSLCIEPDLLPQSMPKTSENRRARCFSLSSTTTHETYITRDEDEDEEEYDSPFLTPAEKAKIRERCLSASSSYPSEGMRSPNSGYCSPEPAAATATASSAHTTRYIAEYRRFGQYPSKSSWYLASLDTEELPSPVSGDDSGDDNEKNRNTDTNTSSSATEIVTPVCACAIPVYGRGYEYQTPILSSFELSENHTDLMPTDMMLPEPRASVIIGTGAGAHQKPSSTSEITVPILENEDAFSSRLEVSFMSYRRPQAGSTSSTTSPSPSSSDNVNGNNNNNNNCGKRRRNKSAVDLLHNPSKDTQRTTLTAIKIKRRSNMTNNTNLTNHRNDNSNDAGDDDDEDDGAWSTIHERQQRRLSRPSSWMQLFSLASTSPSNDNISSSSRNLTLSLNLTQRLQKLKKVRKWAKRACRRTKARFELVGRPKPVSSPGPTSKPELRLKGVGRRKWRLGMKRVRRRFGKKKKNKTKSDTKGKENHRENIGGKDKGKSKKSEKGSGKGHGDVTETPVMDICHYHEEEEASAAGQGEDVYSGTTTVES